MDDQHRAHGPEIPDPPPERAGLAALRCFLFFPGFRPELLSKAVAAGADGVCADLEDAVGPDRKDAARQSVVGLLQDEAGAHLEAPGSPCVIVRVNEPTTPAGMRDLEALAGLRRPPDALIIPKIRAPAEVARVAEALQESGPSTLLIPLVETARALAEVEEIAASASAVAALMIGGHDLAVELGARPGWEPLLYARSRLVHAAALAGVPALDMPSLDVGDGDGLRGEARRSRDLGFSGKAAIHPEQVAPIQEVFSPSPDELERARRIVEAYRASDGDAVLLDGRLVDRPVLEAARRTLARARRDR